METVTAGASAVTAAVASLAEPVRPEVITAGGFAAGLPDYVAQVPTTSPR
ncbi:hypothetical protein [Streptomyces sp. NPDC020996]